jgi:D-alanyl-D-alanine carboxypeptidase
MFLPMKKIIANLILFILLLSACANQEPTATPEPPTAVPPTAAPTEEILEVEAEADMLNLAALTEHPWQWLSFTSPVEQIEVETPDRYRVLFNQDGTMAIVADCNNAAGEYTEDAGALTITTGPATLADCTPGSLTNPFLTYLGSAARYFFEGGNLYIDLSADGGTMVLAPSDNSDMVARGEGDVAPPMFMDGDLVAHPWQWVSFTNPVEQFEVETPEAYLLQFNEDNSVKIVADCNNASGSFTLTTGFSIEIGPMTKAACPPESRSDQFVAYLGSAANYFYEDGNLYIDLLADGGTMVFAPVSSDAMGDDGEGAIAGAADELSLTNPDITWKWASVSDPVNGEIILDESEYVSLTLADGTAILAGNCRFVIGEYRLEENKLTLTYELPEKRDPDCEEGSNEARVFELLRGQTTAFIENGRLHIDLPADGGTLVFDVFDPVAAALEALRVESWDEALDDILTDIQCPAPGAVLLVDTPQGRFLKAQGVASLEDETLVTVEDAFEIGSNTKSFTVVLALQLQEEGVWSLDDPLQTYLPEQAAKFEYGDTVTLRQLAQNRSGIPDYANPIIGAAIENDNLEQTYTPEELVDFVAENMETSFAPGEDSEYSTTNFILLGMAVEAITGQSLAELYQERIFNPLEMADSFLLESVPEEGQIIQGYYTLDDGTVKNVTAWNGSQGWAGGGIVSTAEDVAKYAAGLASGTLFQDPASLGQMLSFDDGFIYPGGYGLGVGQKSTDPLSWGHEGQTPGFQTFWSVYPEQDVHVIFLTNSGLCRVAHLTDIINASPDLLTQAIP